MSYVYTKGVSTGLAITLAWYDRTNTIRDFSSGYTFSATITAQNTPTVLAGTKSSGITGTSGSLGYNVTIDWQTSDFTSLTADQTYDVTLTATPSGGDPFEFPGKIQFRLKSAPV